MLSQTTTATTTAVCYGAGSCELLCETETPFVDELNHYPENTIWPEGELRANSCVCQTA